MKDYPIYDIQKFYKDVYRNDVYVNTVEDHIIANNFIENSHSHTFYLLVLFTNGKGIHKIDLNQFNIERGSLYVLQPGQVHSWKLSNDIEGYIIFYSQELYNLYFGTKKIQDYPFYEAEKNISEIKLDETDLNEIEIYFKLLIKENLEEKNSKLDKLLNIIDTIHIEISRKQLMENRYNLHSYRKKIEIFNNFLNQYYAIEKSPSFYAYKMNISLKHLNRICKSILNKTVTELITQKIIFESKRKLTFSDQSISEIAEGLGFINYSYFAKVFKKQTGITPSEFKTNLISENW